MPLSTPSPGGTIKGIEHAHSLGIRAMEMEWVQRVPGNSEHVEAIAATARTHDVALTVHAPFYINLNSPDGSTLSASKRRMLDALTMAQIAGAVSVCVHAAFYLGKDPMHSLENVRRATDEILKLKPKLFPDVNLAYETMGKQSQFGTLEEVLAISKEFDLYPCIDPAHMHARTNGKINTTDEWNEMFNAYEASLGTRSLQKMHMHFSGIAYGPTGEKSHLPLEESDARWKDFLSVVKKRNIGGILVCESPLQEKDTLLMQNYYDSL